MTPTSHITYNGETFPVFVINIIDQIDEDSAMYMKVISVSVSIESLSKRLIDADTGVPVSSIASAIDEGIFFYIPDELADKEADEIANYVTDNCW